MPKSLEIAFPGFHFQNFRGGPPQLFEVYNYDTVRFQSGSAPAIDPNSFYTWYQALSLFSLNIVFRSVLYLSEIFQSLLPLSQVYISMIINNDIFSHGK